MAATTREIVVDRDIAAVWAFVGDMANWARQMPGYVSHEQRDNDHSTWTLQVNLGPFQRPVVVDVRVGKWQAPSLVEFDVAGATEPFTGGGRYHAEAVANGTRITLEFHAEPGGAMARMVSGLVGPVLERIAEEFSANLRQALQPQIAPSPHRSGRGGILALLGRLLKRLLPERSV